MISFVSGLFFLFSPLVSMLHWRTIQILSKSSLQCNILTRGENKKNNALVMIYLVSGLFFLFSPLVCMLQSSHDLLSIWIVLLVQENHHYSATFKLWERTRRTIQILSKPSLHCNIETRGENKKNNPDTKEISPLVCMLHCSDDLLSIWIVLLVLSPSLYVAL
jgi:hypothetical protein